MNEFEKSRDEIERAVRGILADEMIGHKLDPQTASTAIIAYVFRDPQTPPEEQRYEWFYTRRKLALSIAEGWKANVLPGLAADAPASGASVEGSIQAYLRDTYGANYLDYP